MNILVIGGSFFFGKKIVELLLQCNHNVTVMTRGNNEISNSQVEHLICDCTDLLNLKRVTEGRTWDVILHQVCFDENAARVFSKIFHGKAKRVIVTSSILVYSKMNACEKDFDEKNHEITKCIVKDYSEKKRDVEKIISTEFNSQYVLPRIPVVIGEDDYTGRLSKYVDYVMNGDAVGTKFQFTTMNLITSYYVSKVIVFLIESDFVGALNIAQPGKINVSRLLKIISNKCNLKVVFSTESISPLLFDKMTSINISRLKKIYPINKKDHIIYSVDSLVDYYLKKNYEDRYNK